MEKANIAEDLLRSPSCSTSPFNRALLSSDGWQPWRKKSKPWLAFAGGCTLQCYVSSHLITCSAAQSVPTSRSQHFVEEKWYILMSRGNRSCLWWRAVWFWNLRNAVWSQLAPLEMQYSFKPWVYYLKGLEKTEFAHTLTFPEAKQLNWCQGSSKGIYVQSKKNQWRNNLNIGGRETAQWLEEGKSWNILKILKTATEKRLGLIKAEEKIHGKAMCRDKIKKIKIDEETELRRKTKEHYRNKQEVKMETKK